MSKQMSNPTELPDLEAERRLFEADTIETYAAATFGRFPIGGNYNVSWVQDQWAGWQRAVRAGLAKPEAEEPQAAQMVRIFPDEVISAASEVAWCICLPDGRVELSEIFTDFDEATEYLRERAIAGCSLRGLKFTSLAKE